MTKVTTKTFIIKSLERRNSPRMINGVSFLATNPSGKTIWLDLMFVTSIFSNMGMSTKTPFIKLNGSVVTYDECEIKQEHLDAAIAEGNEGVTVTDRNGREVTFKKIGLKQFAHSLTVISAALQAQIDAVGVTFEDDWAAVGSNNPAPRNTVQAPTPAAVEQPADNPPANEPIKNTEDGAGEPVAEVDLDNEAGM